MKTFSLSTGLLALAVTLTAVADPAEVRRNWPQWRGPLASGFAPEADPPLEWSETKNVKWKVPIPGAGSSTPVIWGHRVFVLTAIRVARPSDPNSAEAPEGQAKRGDLYQFAVLCLDRATGQILWQNIARAEVPHEGIQPNNTYASASPITDGQVVLAFFGSRGLYCYDLEGHLKWSKDLGRMRTRLGFGEGASPALHGETVIVNWDDETDNDFIVALDKGAGKQLWKTPRHEDTGWSTPLIAEHDGRFQVVVNATHRVRSYDLETGREVWSCGGQTPNAIPSPVADAETVYCTSGFRGAALYAIKLSASGDIGGTEAVRWTHNQATPYVPSPLLVDDLIYVLSGNNGILSCLDTKTGQANFQQERLEGVREVYASPVAAKERVYVLSRDGKCVVLKQGPKFEILATNQLEAKTDASIALGGKELFIRSRHHLYCIAGQ